MLVKKIVFVAALCALAACNQREEAPAADATADVAAAPAATTAPVMAADGKDPVGKFRITTSDGEVVDEEVKADGTYVDTIDGKVVETGKWNQKAQGTYCYTKDEAGAKEVCNTEAVDAKGVWTTTDPEGKTATVVRIEA